jgi:hypothetical protein
VCLPLFQARVRIKVEWEPNLSRSGKLKITRHHSDYLETLVIKGDSLVDDLRVAAKPFLPQSITQHGNLISSGPFVFDQEGAAQRGLNAECLEEIAGHTCAGQTLRFAAAGKIGGDRHRDHRCKLFERAVLITVVKIVEGRNTRAVAAVPNVAPGPNQTIGLRKRQRADEHRVNQTKDRCVCTDPQRQSY